VFGYTTLAQAPYSSLGGKSLTSEIFESASATATSTRVKTINVLVTGVQVYVLIGDVLIWAVIDDTQAPNWQNIATTQSSVWSAVTAAQSPVWQTINTVQAPNWTDAPTNEEDPWRSS